MPAKNLSITVQFQSASAKKDAQQFSLWLARRFSQAGAQFAKSMGMGDLGKLKAQFAEIQTMMKGVGKGTGMGAASTQVKQLTAEVNRLNAALKQAKSGTVVGAKGGKGAGKTLTDSEQVMRSLVRKEDALTSKRKTSIIKERKRALAQFKKNTLEQVKIRDKIGRAHV